MIWWIKNIWWIALAAFLILQWNYSHANDDFGIHLEEFSADYARFKDGSRDPVMYPDTPRERLDVNSNVSFFKYGYMNNTIHSETDDTQFRVIGWHYQLGVHVGPWLDIYGEHFSQHLLDESGQNPYPTETMLGVKVYLYRREK